MSESFRTPDGIIQVQAEPGDNGGAEKRFVHGLPTAVVTDIANTASRLASIITSLATIQGYVDGLEGFTDGLETLVGLTNTKLDTVATNQGPPSGGVKFERKTAIGTGLSTQFASQTLTRGLTMFNESTTLDLRVGGSSGSSNYIVVPPRSYSPFFPVSNANLLFFGSASSTVDASYTGS